VVDDPINPWDIAGVFTSLFVGLLSVLLAWRAVTIGRQANEAAVKAAKEAEHANLEASKARAAVANERRRTHELEILRDLLRSFEVTVRGAGGTTTAGPPSQPERYLSIRQIIDREQARLQLLSTNELHTWRALNDFLVSNPDAGWYEWEEKIISVARVDSRVDHHSIDSNEKLLDQATKHVREHLRQEVLVAIRLRVDARDH
jgi:hypothetical protein